MADEPRKIVTGSTMWQRFGQKVVALLESIVGPIPTVHTVCAACDRAHLGGEASALFLLVPDNIKCCFCGITLNRDKDRCLYTPKMPSGVTLICNNKHAWDIGR